MIRVSTRTILVLCAFLIFNQAAKSADRTDPPAGGVVQIQMNVMDSDQKVPIELARVVLESHGQFVAQEVTNPAGSVRFRDIQPGMYRLTAWFIGYAIYKDSIRVDDGHTAFRISLHPQTIQEKEVEVYENRSASASHINQTTGNQVFESETYHAAPTDRMTNLLQENMMGTARAPTGEVHIRGMHGEFTYYLDGIPVPLGVFGGLNEVVDPKAIDRATFITGGFPAEYGGQMAAIIDLKNRVPTGTLHLDASTYAGSYLVFNGTKAFSPGGATPSSAGDTLGSRIGPFRALNSNGQNLSLSDHLGKLGFFLSGSRQETDRRIDPPVSTLFHDHGFDYFVYGKLDYILSSTDYFTSNLNFGRTYTQVPYDSVEQIASDVQKTTNGFQTLSYFHVISSEIDRESNLFVGGYAREGGLVYTPGELDPPNFQFAGDTTQSYSVTEDRTFTTLGLRTTYDRRFSHHLMYKVGLNASSTTGKENFTSKDSLNAPGPSILSNFAGSDFGVFAETEWHPLDWTSFDVGVRYDQHIAPNTALQNQVSPRVRWNFLIDANNTAYLYYGRLFMPTNVEGLRSIALNVSNSLTPTLPERDNFFEAVYTHSFPFGLRSKAAAYYKLSKPGIDDQTVGNTAIKTPVNIQTVYNTGIEAGLAYASPSTPFSGYVNAALDHAYGSGAITGGFLDVDNAGVASDLDHDQRLSAVIGVNYQPRNWFANLEAIYGSGLANGNPDGAAYGTGLFDFNTATHVTPSWILNVSAGRTFRLTDGATFEPSLYITNLFDHAHLIKGAYFSGASWEERRDAVLKLAVHV